MRERKFIRGRWVEVFPRTRHFHARRFREAAGAPREFPSFSPASRNLSLKKFAELDEFYFGFSDKAQQYLYDFYEDFSAQRKIWMTFERLLRKTGIPPFKEEYIDFPATEHGEFGILIRSYDMQHFTPKELQALWQVSLELDEWICDNFAEEIPPD